MPVVPVLHFSSPICGILAILAAIAVIAIAIYRKLNFPRPIAILFASGLLVLAAAALSPIWNHPKRGVIAVMVDLSPSTRGAQFRNADDFRKRLSELIGTSPHQLFSFATDNRPLDPAGPFAEIPTDNTIFTPPPADTIVLFSDARFDSPISSPPVYVVADPALENPVDASVEQLQRQGQSIIATINNSGSPRTATINGTTVPANTGTFLVSQPAAIGPTATAEISHQDLWPENDSLSFPNLPPSVSEKWWIGQDPPNAAWRSLIPAQIPDQPERLLAPSIIVLNNQPADAFSQPQLDRLTQYVRDLGGAILILGGDRAFASGGYTGTTLDQLNPLASFPPTATRRWILLADGSGSMAQTTSTGATRWQSATDAIVRILPTLPPADLVQVGQFSDTLHWWIDPQPAADAAKLPLPPAGDFPHGPTNLESSLQSIASQTEASYPTNLLLLSDCDAEFTYAPQLAIRLQEKNIHVYALAIGHGSAIDTVRQIAASTGGNIVEQLDPHNWTNSLRQLCQAALPPSFVKHSIGVLFLESLKSLSPEMAPYWNHVWVKPDADLWASTLSAPTSPAGAFWHVGSGCVLSLAFETDATNIDFITNTIAAKPRDPRFSITWQNATGHRVIVTASERGVFLNKLPVWLDLFSSSLLDSKQLKQTAPGRYEAPIPPSAESRIATLRVKDEIIDRAAIPARYAEEFDAVGNDHDAMRSLAESTHGQVIFPADHNAINFHWPNVQTSLAPWLCFTGLILITTGIVLWRLKRPDAY
jgi:hypothetical protein